MSTTVIPKLESSDNSRTPILFRLSVHGSPKTPVPDSERELPSMWDVSQSGVPADEEEENNCSIDLSVQSSNYDAHPSNPPDREMLTSDLNAELCDYSLKDLDVSSSCENDSSMNNDIPPQGDMLNLSTNSKSSDNLSANFENNENLALCSGNDVHIPVKSKVKAVTDHTLPLTSDSTVSSPMHLENLGGIKSVENHDGMRPVESMGNFPIKEENTHGEELVEPENSGFVSIKQENNSSDYENAISENESNISDIPESNNDMVNITDNSENNITMNLSSEEASEIVNVSEMDSSQDIVNVTSTTERESVNTPIDPEQEVVDVESYQPCVVDLTCEDEDDVDVVAVVEPVIYIGREQGRQNRENNPPPVPLQVEDLTVGGEDREETIDDDTNNNAVINEEVDNELVDNDIWFLMNRPEIDLQNPNLTFGSLLEQVQVETVDLRSLATAHRPYRELRRSTRRQRRSRSRSPNLFPLMDVDGHRPRRRHLRSPILMPHMDIDDNPPHMGNLMDELYDDVMNEEAMREEHLELMDGPNILPLNANQMVAAEHHHRVARILPPNPPPSPPPVEQPTISCLVCLDSIATINNSSRSLCSTVCGHVFCSACIEEVVKQRKQCPVCRKKLTKRQYHPLFI